MDFLSDTGVAAASRASDTASAALAIPAPRAIGLAPAATLRSPAFTMAWANTVAVVVPSPATSLVLVATDLTSCAPRFSNGSSRSISRAMVTPSLVTTGPPNALASTTWRPRGPRVTRTASASLSTPASRARRAVSLNSICLLINVLRGAMRTAPDVTRTNAGGFPGGRYTKCLLVDDGQHVAGREDQVLLAAVLDLGAAVLAVDDGVAFGNVQGGIRFSPSSSQRPGANCDDGAFLRLFLGGVGG